MSIHGGSCHCGGIRYALEWPRQQAMSPRKCGCSFCVKHGCTYVGHPLARLSVQTQDPRAVIEYAFATGSARFHICARCGAVPFVTAEIDGRVRAVVNANTFDRILPGAAQAAVLDHDGESVQARLARWRRTWIGQVSRAAARPDDAPSG